MAEEDNLQLGTMAGLEPQAPMLEPEPQSEDVSQTYMRIAQDRTMDANIQELRDRVQRRRNEEFEKPKQAIPFVSPASGAPSAEGAGTLPWYKSKTFGEVYDRLYNWSADQASQFRQRPLAKFGEANLALAETAGAVGKDVAKGIFLEGKPFVTRGLTTAGRELVTTVKEMDHWLSGMVRTTMGLDDPNAEGELTKRLQEGLPKADDVAGKPDTVTAAFGEEAVRFIAGFIPAFQATKGIQAARSFGQLGSRIGPATREAVEFATSRTGRAARYGETILAPSVIAEGVTHPASDPNIANLVEAAPFMSNWFTQAMSAKPDDGIFWGKFKSALVDGGLSGILADGVLLGVRSIAAKQRVVPELSALEQLHGNQAPGDVLTGGEGPFMSAGGPPPANPFQLDFSTPEARAASEGTLRGLLAGDGGIRIEAQPIYDDVFQKLRDAGLPEDQAAANAAVWAQRYATRADRLGTGESALDLYRNEEIDIERVRRDVTAEAPARETDAALAQDAPIPSHIQKLYDNGAIVSDGGAVKDITDLREMLRRKASPEEIEANPIISAAIRLGHSNTVKPTIDRPGFGTPEWQANRDITLFDGTPAKGYPAAQKALYQQFISAADGNVKAEKKAVIVTGPGGSGKSTIMKPLAREMGAAIVDVDEAKKLFPEYNSGIGSNTVHEESSIITFIEGGPFRQLVDEGANILIQKIGHTPASLRKLQELMTKLGYTVSTINVKVDPDEAFRRRIARYIKTGRINSSSYADQLKESGDQPINTYNILKKEKGFYEEAAQIDLNGRTPILTEGEGTNLAKYLQPILGTGERSGFADGSGQRRGAGQVYDSGAGGVGFEQGGLIRSAALRIGGKVYEGPSHFDAIMKALDEGVEFDKIPDKDQGFILQDGSFVSREEAAQLVDREGSLHSEDIGLGPQVDSGTLVAREGETGVGVVRPGPFARERQARRRRFGSFDQRVPPFYSSVERTIAGSKTQSATGAQWLGALRNTPGVKKEELEWLGVDRFLADQKGQVSKVDIEQYVAANRVEVKEVRKQDIGDVDEISNEIADVVYQRWLDDPNVQARVEQKGDRWFVIDDHDNVLDEVVSKTSALGQAEDFNRAIKEKDIDVLLDWSREVGDRQVKLSGAARYTEYQLPGGGNYRELLLTLPTRSTSLSSDSQQNFISSHWNEANVLAHVRMNDRVIDGKRTLFIEEIQSDWHQQGRKKGYNRTPKQEDLIDGKKVDLNETDKALVAIQSALSVREGTKTSSIKWEFKDKNSNQKLLGFGDTEAEAKANAIENYLPKSIGIPDAPFKKTWHELALKRLIRIAADEGYEQIAWTSGKTQAERYDLSKQLDEVTAQRNIDGTFIVGGRDQRKNYHNFGQAISEDELPDYVGKDLAEKIIKDFPKGYGRDLKRYSGLDLQVGGEGMKGFYDKMLPAAADAIGKPFWAKSGTAKLDINERHVGVLSRKPLEDVHTLEVTPELRKTAQEQGFRLFQESGDPAQPPVPGTTNPRGRITFQENRTLIQLFSQADASTFMHESAHQWFTELARDAEVSPQIKSDLQETLRWLGADDVSTMTREQHETWSRTFEQYLATGEAPSEALKGVFERFKDWIVSVYRAITGGEVPGASISPEIQGVFDRLIASDPELAASGRRRLFADDGTIAPELAPLVQSRLAEQGYDALMIARPADAGAPIITRFDPSLTTAMGKIDDAFRTTESGVPVDVMARGVTGSATDAASRAGIARVLRASDEPVSANPNIYINFARINAADDVKQVIRDMADAFRPEIDEAQRGIQTNDETSRLAEQLGMTTNDLLNRRRGEPFNAEQSLAARRLLTTSAEQLNQLAQRAALPNSSLADQYNFRKMMAIHHAIQSEVIAARTETARALQAWSIPASGNIEMARDISSLIESMGGSATAQAMAKATADLFRAGVSPGAIADMTKRGWAQTTLEGVREMFTLGLLWMPTTHIANMASNLSVAFMQVYERGSARLIGDLLDTGDGRVISGEALAMMYGMTASLKDAFVLGGKALITGESGIATGTKFDQNLGAIGSHVVSREKGHTLIEAENFSKTVLGRFLDFFGTATRIPGNLLAAEDESFKAIVWRGEVYAQALRQATEEGMSSFPDRFNRMRELANNPPEHIRMAAVDSATYTTFQSKLGTIGQGLMKMRSGRLSPLFLVMPFIKTPLNILSYAFEHSPLAPLVARWRDDIASGGARRDLALARMATGTAIMATAMDYAANGSITGAGPSDPGQKEAWLRQGWQPNSIRIGDKYYSFNRADPIGMLLGFAGTMAESMKAQELSPEKYDAATEIAAAMIATFSASVVDKTYLQGIAGVINAIQGSEQGSGRLENFINQQTGALLPFSSAFNFHKRFIDPTLREVHSPLDAIRSKIATWAQDLPPKRDLWGEERKPQEVFGRAYDVLSPFAVSQREDSPIDAEIERLNISLRRIQFKSEFAGADINFHEWPQVYDRYVVLAGNELKHPAWGMGMKDFFNAVVTGKHELSDYYQNFLSDGKDGGKAAWISNQVSQFRKLAQQQIMMEEKDRFPEFVAWVNARKAQRIEMRLPTPMQGQGLTEGAR